MNTSFEFYHTESEILNPSPAFVCFFNATFGNSNLL